MQVPTPGLDESAADTERHLGIVSDLARLQLEPASADHSDVKPKRCGNLAFGHELDRSAERIADGKAEVGAQGAVEDRVRIHGATDGNFAK
jgi:hypothetical protein